MSSTVTAALASSKPARFMITMAQSNRPSW